MPGWGRHRFSADFGADFPPRWLHVAEKGGGSYLEWHDRPHLHMPLDADAGGYLILGRRDGDDYVVSAFRILFGSAVYIPPEVLHADPYLVGNYLVIYSVTKNFPTPSCAARTEAWST